MEFLSREQNKGEPKMKRRKTTKIVAAVIAAVTVVLALSACTATKAPDVTPSPSLVVRADPTEPTAQSSDPGQSAEEPAPSEKEPSATPPSETEEVKPIEPMPLYHDVLTGRYVLLDPSGMRPVAVVVDNSADALAHQSGLIQAGVVYETITAPGTTRFLAIYTDYRAIPDVCNIRAGRAHDARIASMYNAAIVSLGGHTDKLPEYDFFSAVSELYGSPKAFVNTQRESAWTAQNAEELGTVRYYENGYRPDIKYDTVLTGAALEFTAGQTKNSDFLSAGGTLTGTAKNPIKISDAAPLGENSSGVTISFTASGVYSPLKKTVSMRYSLSEGVYLRFEDGRPHVDSASGEQLKFTNVIVLKTDVKYIEGDSDIDPLTADVSVYGSGTGYFMSGGKCVSLVWVNTADGGMKLYTPAGELSVPAGNTYVAFVDRSNDGAIVIE